MRQVISSDNSILKLVTKLSNKKFRDDFGMFKIEGEKMVRELFDCTNSQNQQTNFVAEHVIISEEMFSKFEYLEKFVELIGVPTNLFARISDTVNSQGIIAICSIKHMSSDDELSENFSETVLVLDRIRDPGNMGSIIRTACAYGARDIFAIGCVDTFNEKVIRSCMSGIYHTRVHNVNFDISNNSIIDKLKKLEYNIVCGDMKGASLFDIAIPGKIALVIGNEANGISDEIKSAADYLVSIPINNVESLNASVACGILLYGINTKKV